MRSTFAKGEAMRDPGRFSVKRYLYHSCHIGQALFDLVRNLAHKALGDLLILLLLKALIETCADLILQLVKMILEVALRDKLSDRARNVQVHDCFLHPVLSQNEYKGRDDKARDNADKALGDKSYAAAAAQKTNDEGNYRVYEQSHLLHVEHILGVKMYINIRQSQIG